MARCAAWAHESDPTTIAEPTDRGYRFDGSTRAMATSRDAIPVPEAGIELGEASGEECLRIPDVDRRHRAATGCRRIVRSFAGAVRRGSLR